MGPPGLAARSLAAFVPAGQRFDTCLAFYRDLGFGVDWQEGDFAQLRLGDCRFILQRVDFPGASDNFMLDLQVDDLDGWWRHIEALDLARHGGLTKAKAPERYPWGKREIHLLDPAGNFWHIWARG